MYTSTKKGNVADFLDDSWEEGSRRQRRGKVVAGVRVAVAAGGGEFRGGGGRRDWVTAAAGGKG